jgi:hypothetical protein
MEKIMVQVSEQMQTLFEVQQARSYNDRVIVFLKLQALMSRHDSTDSFKSSATNAMNRLRQLIVEEAAKMTFEQVAETIIIRQKVQLGFLLFELQLWLQIIAAALQKPIDAAIQMDILSLLTFVQRQIEALGGSADGAWR